MNRPRGLGETFDSWKHYRHYHHLYKITVGVIQFYFALHVAWCRWTRLRAPLDARIYETLDGLVKSQVLFWVTLRLSWYFVVFAILLYYHGVTVKEGRLLAGAVLAFWSGFAATALGFSIWTAYA